MLLEWKIVTCLGKRVHGSKVIVAKTLLQLLSHVELRVVNLDLIPLPCRIENTAMHHSVHQILLLLTLTVTACNTLAPITVTHR